MRKTGVFIAYIIALFRSEKSNEKLKQEQKKWWKSELNSQGKFNLEYIEQSLKDMEDKKIFNSFEDRWRINGIKVIFNEFKEELTK